MLSNNDIMHNMNNKQHKTLIAIFSRPTPTNLEFKKIESLFMALGAELIEGSGSRVRFVFNDSMVTFNIPHTNKEAKPYQVRDARLFLQQIGVTP